MRVNLPNFRALAAIVIVTALPRASFAQLGDDQVPTLRQVGVNGALVPPDRSAQISAATDDAVQKLYRDIADEQLSPQLTIRRFVESTGGRDQLMQTLRRAEQIGGPRWIDDQTCQVKLALPAEQVTRTLMDIAAARTSPIPPEALAVKLKEWKRRTLIETGTSIASSRVQELRPMNAPAAWRMVSEDERRRAVEAAKENAVHRVLDGLRGLEVAPAPTFAQAMSNKTFSERFSQWLASRPITSVQFRPDLFVELTLGVSAGELFDAFVDAARTSGAVKLPDDPQKLQLLRQEFEERAGQPVGRAHVAANPGTSQATPITIPTRPPTWTQRGNLTAAGAATFRKTRLLTAQAAEAQASEKLRDIVLALPLDDQHSLSDAARYDPEIQGAVNRALSHARIYKIDYQADGGAFIRVTLDPRDIWDEIREIPDR